MTHIEIGDMTTALGRLGFSLYEAKAYCALIGQEPMIGNEVAKASGIPASKVYETLDRLIEKGCVRIQRAEPRKYVAAPYDEVLSKLRAQFETAILTAEQGFSAASFRPDAGEIWSLQNYASVLAACRKRIQSSTRSLFAAFWDRELEYLKDDLEAASKRGVTVHIAVYGHMRFEGPSSYDLSLCGDSAAKRLGGQRLSAVVSDVGDALVAIFQNNESVEAVATTNSVISLLTIEYIRADVLGRLLINELGEKKYAEMQMQTPDFHRILQD